LPPPSTRLGICVAIAAAAGGCMASAPSAGARPRLALRPSSGRAGASVRASLSGFRPSSRGQIRFGHALVARLRTDRHGRAIARFRVPRRARGRVVVSAEVSIPSRRQRRHSRGHRRGHPRYQRARAAFRVTPAPAHGPVAPALLPVSADHPCGATASAPARYSHVFVIVFENSNYSDIIGGRDTPYTTRLSQACGSATRYFGLQRPSLPNYIALTSGGTQGVNDDRGPSGNVAADNIFNQVKQSGREWRQYSSRMPSNCYMKDDPPAPNAYYTAHHEPAPYYANIQADCRRWDVPLGTTSSGALASDLDRNALPAFAWIGPADDGGNSSQGGEVDPKLGDPFLQAWVSRIVSSAAYRSGDTAILITWDEGDFNHSSGSPDFMNVPAIVVAPSVRPGTQVSTRLTHYSLLRTAEEMLGLPLLGHAADAGTPSMRPLFNL